MIVENHFHLYRPNNELAWHIVVTKGQKLIVTEGGALMLLAENRDILHVWAPSTWTELSAMYDQDEEALKHVPGKPCPWLYECEGR